MPTDLSSADRPVIVALHGFLSSSRYWRRLERRLKDAGFDIITIDLLGFGRSVKPTDSAYDYDAHIAHVKNTLDVLGINRPFILMGHSMGALVAARYARQYPDSIERTVLLHPPLYKTREEAYTTLRSTGAFYRFLLDSRLRGAAWGTLRNIPFSAISHHTKQSREESLRNIIEEAKLIEDLTKAIKPTLLLNGLRDRPIYQANLHHICDLPNVQIEQAPVAHHSPVFNPKLVASTIIRFAG